MKRIFITLAMMLFLVASNVLAQEITPGKAIDLGLPSGTIWAGWNVGATSPEQYGDYYAWGETKTKSDYSEDKYKYHKKDYRCKNIGLNISGTKYDVARQKWGGSWRMPTKEEFDELSLKCKWYSTTYKGVYGYKVTGPNGNSIFLPAAGGCSGRNLLLDAGQRGRYWSATLSESGSGCYYACGFTFLISTGRYFILDTYSRFRGLTIRPVM